MKYICFINEYGIYEYSKEECREYGCEYPTFGAFYATDPDMTPLDSDCSMGCISDLVDWCEDH